MSDNTVLESVVLSFIIVTFTYAVIVVAAWIGGWDGLTIEWAVKILTPSFVIMTVMLSTTLIISDRRGI